MSDSKTLSVSVSELTIGLVSLARKQNGELSVAAKPLALEIARAADPTKAAQASFDAVFGEFLAAKASNAKDAATAIGAAWNRVKPTLRYHLKAEGLAVEFQSLKDGSGVTKVQALSDASDERKALKIANDAVQADALVAFRESQAAAESAAIREMTQEQVVSSMLATLATWSPDTKAQIDALQDALVALGVAKAPKAPKAPRTNKAPRPVAAAA